MAKCHTCSVELISGVNWYRSKEKTRQYICKECLKNKSREWQQKNRERYNKRQREYLKKYTPEYYKKNKDKYSAAHKKYITKIKNIVFNHYGKGEIKCDCCGEKLIEFLTIDHINGNGTKHRKDIGIAGGERFYYWLYKNNFPEGYRILCYNCNCSLGFHGYCPHNKKI